MDNFINNAAFSYGMAKLSQYAVDNLWLPDDVDFYNYNDITATYNLYTLGDEFNNKYDWW